MVEINQRQLKGSSNTKSTVTIKELNSSNSLLLRKGAFAGTAKRIANYFATASLGLGVAAPKEAKGGGLYQNGTTSQQTTDMGLQFQGKVLSFRVYSPQYTGNPAGQKNATASFVNSRHAIAPYHIFSGAASNITGMEVADGPNYIANRGNVVSISEYILHPEHDLVILRFTQPFPFSTDSVIGTVNVGDVTYCAGYGSWGTPATGMARDGNLRAFDARVTDTVYSGSAPYYQTNLFGFGNLNGLTLNARAGNGDSGGRVSNSLGQLVGVIVSGSSSIASTGNTNYICVGEPSIKAWIEANTQIPKPELRTAKTQNGIVLSWDINAVGWLLQKSGDLNTWTDISTTILAPGSYADTGNENRQFFRLRKP